MDSVTDRLHGPLRAARRAVQRRRRLLAAVCAAVAVGASLIVLKPPPEATVEVIVAARDLPSGTSLTSDDVIEVRLPADAVPGRAADTPGEVTGRVLAGPVTRGEAITDVRLVGPGLAAGRSDLVALPVRIPDAASIDLLQVGDAIDLLAIDPQGADDALVASDAEVLATPSGSGEVGASGLPGGLVVVGVDPTEVGAVAEATVRAVVTFNWSRR